MKIEKLILKNFSAVHNAMETKKITIDFTTGENKICLLIGPNGSGKTTIMSLLNPFADVGNLDVRNGNHLILEDEEGYKEIHLRKGESLYIIKHYYFPHKGKSHSVKSYIEKDGVELNPNGNVGSFKEWVREELQIEPEYLKLIRLGSNVTSLIDLSSTERKNFMSKIMEEINVYLEYYKSMGTKQKQLSEMISHSVDKMNKLGILDRENFISSIEDNKENYKVLNGEYLDANVELGVEKTKLSEIPDLETLPQDLKETEKKFRKMENIINNKDSLESTDVSFYEKEYESLDKTTSSLEVENNSLELVIKSLLDKSNSLYERLRSIQLQIEKEGNLDREISLMTDELLKSSNKASELGEHVGNYVPEITASELNEFIIFLKNQQMILTTTYDFGKPIVAKVIEVLESGKNVNKYINSHIRNIDEDKNEYNSFMLAKLYSLVFTNNKRIVINCDKECKAKDVFNQIQTMLETESIDDKNETIDFYRNMELAAQNINRVLESFKDYKEVINKLPKDLKESFELKKIYESIKNLKVIYDEKKFNDLSSLVTEYEAYIKLLDDIEDQKKKIKKLKELSNSSELTKEQEKLKEDISQVSKDISSYKQQISSNKETISENKKTMEHYLDVKDTLSSFDEIREKYSRLVSDYDKSVKLRQKIEVLNLNVMRLQTTLEKLNSEIQESVSKLNQYDDLNKDVKKMNKLYDDFTFIRNSLSSKEGIPLYIIRNYLDDTEEITNELLNIVYDGKIFLDKFNITATEFSIPFYNRGLRLDDVKYASQGEISFLSIALSFALASKALSKYNIMLLDEIDGPLDTRNREKFIEILENQIDRIHSEQNFLITHNDMFSSYPVDILDLSFENNTDDYSMANFIKIEKG